MPLGFDAFERAEVSDGAVLVGKRFFALYKRAPRADRARIEELVKAAFASAKASDRAYETFRRMVRSDNRLSAD